MESQSESGSKPFEASQHKLEQARKKGELARSSDLNSAFVYAGILLAAILGGATTLNSLGDLFVFMLDQSSDLTRNLFQGSSAGSVSGLIFSILIDCLIWFAFPLATLFIGVVVQRSFTITPEKLKPKLSRISVIKNAKNKYGSSGLFEFVKSSFKLVLFSLLLVVYLKFVMPKLIGTLNVSPGIISQIFGSVLIEFLSFVLVISLLVGIGDYSWHYFAHLRQQRMSYKEVQDETKEQEGDPYLKQERKLRASRLSGQQLTATVPQADVVIVNPSHYAVALKWSREKGAAPRCIAKGVDDIALAIRKIATENCVPIREDPPTARALFASTEIGHEIDAKHYRAVATAIRFAEYAKKRAKYWS